MKTTTTKAIVNTIVRGIEEEYAKTGQQEAINNLATMMLDLCMACSMAAEEDTNKTLGERRTATWDAELLNELVSLLEDAAEEHKIPAQQVHEETKKLFNG